MGRKGMKMRKNRILPILALIIVVLCIVISLIGLASEREEIMPEHLPTPANTSTPIEEILSPTAMPVAQPTIASQVCCKNCIKGKACGDSCIAKDKDCPVGSGCACNGD